MKLVIAAVSTQDADELLRALSTRGFGATKVDTSGRFLRQGNVTIFVGVQDARVGDVLRLVKAHGELRFRFANPLMPVAEPGDLFASHPVELHAGGATVFVVNVERYERIV